MTEPTAAELVAKLRAAARAETEAGTHDGPLLKAFGDLHRDHLGPLVAVLEDANTWLQCAESSQIARNLGIVDELGKRRVRADIVLAAIAKAAKEALG